MQTREELIARFKAFRQRQFEEAQSRLQSAIEHGLIYSSEHRSENLRLLRSFFNAGQESFAMLVGISSQSQYSLIERGEHLLSEYSARGIERELGLPEYWLDRCNSTVLFLTQDELSLVNQLRRVKPGAALKLAEAVKLLTSNTSIE